MRVAVTGGAGYIGAHVVRALRERGDDVVVIDDLSSGDSRRIEGLPLHQFDLVDPGNVSKLSTLFGDCGTEAVIHFAARKRVDESVARPAWYYQQNIGSLANVLEAMAQKDVGSLIFSSSAAVYGTTEGSAISESDPTNPVNPYGATKLVGEQLVAAATQAFPLRAASLRYFNVAGAGWPDLADTAALNLVPMVFERIVSGARPLIFGDDYPTPDGTCVRDFIHVLDLAEAHLQMLDRTSQAPAGHEVVNVGTGKGWSVRQVIDAILVAAKSDAVPEVRQRRAGDPAEVVADSTRIRARTPWAPKFGIEAIVQSAWDAYSVSHAQQRARGLRQSPADRPGGDEPRA